MRQLDALWGPDEDELYWFMSFTIQKDRQKVSIKIIIVISFRERRGYRSKYICNIYIYFKSFGIYDIIYIHTIYPVGGT